MGWGEEEEEEAFALSLAGQITEKYEFGAAAAVLATRKGGRGMQQRLRHVRRGRRASVLSRRSAPFELLLQKRAV